VLQVYVLLCNRIYNFCLITEGENAQIFSHSTIEMSNRHLSGCAYYAEKISFTSIFVKSDMLDLCKARHYFLSV